MEDKLLKQDGFYLLLETGDHILLDEYYIESVSTLSGLADLNLQGLVIVGGIVDVQNQSRSTVGGFTSFLSPFHFGVLSGFSELEAVNIKKTLAGLLTIEKTNVKSTLSGLATLQHYGLRTFGGTTYLIPSYVKGFAGIVDLLNYFTAVSFSGFDINNAVDITETAVHDSASTRNIVSYKTARREGENIVSSYFAQKEISVTGFVQSNSQVNLEKALDAFKLNVQRSNGVLRIGYITGARLYKANFSELTIQRTTDNVDWTPFTVKFYVPSGKGQDEIQTNVLFSGITSTYYTNVFNNIGSANAVPVVTFTINTQSSMSSITFQDLTTGNYIVVTGTFNNGDVIIIDFDQFTVTVNGSPVAYTGSFPIWQTGQNSFIVNSTASSINFNLQFSYYANYI